MVLAQIPPYPGILAYWASPTGGKIHIAVKWQGKSLCGLQVAQSTWQPVDGDGLCQNCLNAVRVMGRIAI